MNAVDTNVLVYFVDQDEPLKRGKAIELLDKLVPDDVETVLLWQVATKFLSCLRRWEQEGGSPARTSGNFQQFDLMFRCVLQPKRSYGNRLT